MTDYENGINGATGEYLFPLNSPKQIAEQAKDTLLNISLIDPHRMELSDRSELRNLSKAPKAGVDPTNLAQAGWGVIFLENYTPFSLEALKSDDGIGVLLSAADVDSSANIHGTIAFQFACYSLGTPQFNNFKNKGGDPELAASPIVARLPQKLLSHEKGGALAVIGHVDRAFSSSFRDNNIRQSAVFQSVLTCLMQGDPVGYAMEFFIQQYAELATDTTQGIQEGIKDTAIVDL